jgi:hypothetical protein
VKGLPEVYYIAPNGMKIKFKGFDMLKITDVKVHEGKCLDVALTDELRNKGSVEVTFKYGEVDK